MRRIDTAMPQKVYIVLHSLICGVVFVANLYVAVGFGSNFSNLRAQKIGGDND